MTYSVFGETLNIAQSVNLSLLIVIIIIIIIIIGAL